MEHELQNTIALLERTPAALDALLRGLPEMWTENNEGENTWSVRAVLAHLIHGEEEDWIPRARMILESGEGGAFAPFDREGHVRYGQGKALEQLLDEFAQTRAKGLSDLRALKLTAEDLQRRGRHPALGTVTLSELLATWAMHDLTHLHQISRIMAYQYRQAVGPWVRFLGVMQCAGHSASA
ncbi:MAG: DinB family protein [Terracidiphilus sp.]